MSQLRKQACDEEARQSLCGSAFNAASQRDNEIHARHGCKTLRRDSRQCDPRRKSVKFEARWVSRACQGSSARSSPSSRVLARRNNGQRPPQEMWTRGSGWYKAQKGEEGWPHADRGQGMRSRAARSARWSRNGPVGTAKVNGAERVTARVERVKRRRGRGREGEVIL